MDNQEIEQLKQKLKRINEKPELKDFYKRYSLGVIWDKNIFKVLNKIIYGGLNGEEKLQAVQHTVLFNIDTQDEVIKEKSFKCWQFFFKKKGVDLKTLEPALRESRYHQKESIFTAFGRLFSLDFLMKINLLFDIKEYLKDNLSTFLEIGGGDGSQARVIKIKYPESRYLMIDLPETLFFAYINLRLDFPDAKIKFGENKDEVEKTILDNDFDFLLVPCFLSEYLSSVKIDLVINTCSLGEMSNKMSKYYLGLIENKFNVKYILFLNRFLNNFDPKYQPQRLKENGCYTQMGPDWKIIHWELEPEFRSFPFHEQCLPRELYLIAEKSKEIENYDIKDIFLHYWYRNFTVRPYYNSKLNNNISIDKGKNSVIARLVNSVRVKPDKKNLDALIKYIYTLEGRFPFEERYYYMDLYKKITGKKHKLHKSPLRNFYIERFFFDEIDLFYLQKFLDKIHFLETARRFRWWILGKIKEKNK